MAEQNITEALGILNSITGSKENFLPSDSVVDKLLDVRILLTQSAPTAEVRDALAVLDAYIPLVNNRNIVKIQELSTELSLVSFNLVGLEEFSTETVETV